MKPLRRVMSVTRVIAFKLDCGHTMYRSGKVLIPMRIACTECQLVAYRAFDREQAIAKAVREAIERVNQK